MSICSNPHVYEWYYLLIIPSLLVQTAAVNLVMEINSIVVGFQVT